MRNKDRNTYMVFGTMTIILYVVGIFTGFFLFTNSVASSDAKAQALQSQIDDYRDTLEWMRMEQLYLNSPREEIGCAFLTSSIEKVHNDLSYFIKNLPDKLEIYEKDNQVDQVYEDLKKDYM